MFNMNWIQNQSTMDNSTASESDLRKQLDILNLSIATIYIFVLAIFLNINFLYGERSRLLDAINGTNFSQGLPDLSDSPRISNDLAIKGKIIFLGIYWEQLQSELSLEQSERNEAETLRASNSVIAGTLTLISSLISRNSFDL